MTVYFDFKINTKPGNFTTYIRWHNQLPLLAIGTRTLQSSATYVTIFDQLVGNYCLLDNKVPVELILLICRIIIENAVMRKHLQYDLKK